MGVADDNEVALVPVEVEVDRAEVGFGDTDEGGFVTLVLVDEVAVGDEFGQHAHGGGTTTLPGLVDGADQGFRCGFVDEAGVVHDGECDLADEFVAGDAPAGGFVGEFFVDTFSDAGVEGVVEPKFDFGADDGLDGKPEIGPTASAEDDVDAVAEAALCELFDGFR